MKMTFERAKNLVKFCLAGTVACCVLALITQNSPAAVGLFTAGALVLLLLTFFFAFTSLKCPYCGRTIFKKCFVVKACPHCGRDLATGLKAKKKSRR